MPDKTTTVVTLFFIFFCAVMLLLLIIGIIGLYLSIKVKTTPSIANCDIKNYNNILGSNSSLSQNNILNQCNKLQSPDGKHVLLMQPDGNLVLYNISNPNAINAIWSTGTNNKGTGPYYFSYGSDGNLVVYDSTNTSLWNSSTNNKTSNILQLQSDGNLVLYNGTNAVWSTGTYNK